MAICMESRRLSLVTPCLVLLVLPVLVILVILVLTRHAMSLAALLLRGATLAAAAPPARPPLLQTFSANMTGYSFAPGTGNMTSNAQPIAISVALQQILNVEVNPDGRAVQVVFDYHNDTRAGIWSLQPFFDEHVCFIFPPQPVPAKYNKFQIGVEFLWFNQAWDPSVGLWYNQSKFEATSVVAGQACDVWTWGTPCVSGADCDEVRWCVDRQTGGLYGVNRSVVIAKQKYNQQLRNVFSAYVPSADASKFKRPVNGCADMRPISGGGAAAEPNVAKADHRVLNDAARLAEINAAAGGAWTAGEQPGSFGRRTAEQVASESLGLRSTVAHVVITPPAWQRLTGAKVRTVLRAPGALHKLGLPSAEHVAKRSRVAAKDIPKEFDLRKKFAQCASVTAIRNQGACGSCWAFAGVETLADRLCVASPSKFSNLTLSPEYIMDCDTLNAACGGGLLDDAWIFLAKKGVAAEACDPYLYCAHPVSASCETGVHPPRPPPHKVACPARCKGGAAPALHKAKNAYAVAKPADVPSMQQEIVAHGSIEVGFQVFSDFMSYKNGTYSRTKGAQGPKGGHAVKVVGWGVDPKGVDYWIVANSWSPMWGGLKGFFHIRRGTNECGIETTPAAGLPDTTVTV